MTLSSSRTVATATVLVVVVLIMVGWWTLGRRSSPDVVQSADDAQSVGNQVEVFGNHGAIPTVTIHGTLTVTAPFVRTIIEGQGREITEGSPVIAAITPFDGDTGEVITADGQPAIFTERATSDELDATLVQALIGSREGTRLLFVRPLTPAADKDGETLAGTTPAQPRIEIDVVDVISSTATGTPIDPEPTQPFSVEFAEDGFKVTHTGEAPSQIVIAPHIKGDGPQVGPDDRVLVQYVIAGWNNPDKRRSTWNDGMPERLDMATIMPGLQQGLVDQRVGSRLAITIPPDLAEGDDTLCVLVDILATYPPSSSTS